MIGAFLKTVLLLGAFFLTLAVGLGTYMGLQPPKVAEDMKRVIISDEASKEFDRKIQGFLAEANYYNTQQYNNVSTAITQEEIASKIAEVMSEENSRFILKDIQVNLRDDKIVAAGDLDASGFKVRMGIVATVENNDGKPELRVIDVDFGQLPMPQVLRDEIDKAVANLNSSFRNLPVFLEDMRTEDGQVVLEGSPQ